MTVFAVGTRQHVKDQKVAPETIFNELTLPPVELISGHVVNKNGDLLCSMLLRIICTMKILSTNDNKNQILKIIWI
jgi:hypothetical protein